MRNSSILECAILLLATGVSWAADVVDLCQELDPRSAFCSCEVRTLDQFDHLSGDRPENNQRFIQTIVPKPMAQLGFEQPLFLAGVGHEQGLSLCLPELRNEVNRRDFFGPDIVEEVRGETYYVVMNSREIDELSQLSQEEYTSLDLFDDISYIFDALVPRFALGRLVYLPMTEFERDRLWDWPGGPPVEIPNIPQDIQVYSAGAVSGMLRYVPRDQWDRLRAEGSLTRQDILLLDHLPLEFDVPVAGVITSVAQGLLSHINILCLREGVPNVFVPAAVAEFSSFDGEPVRLEASGKICRVDPGTLEDVRVDLLHRRPPPLAMGAPDDEYDELPSLEALAGTLPTRRVGGKAAYLAQFLPALPPETRVRGFAIPFSYFVEYLRSNVIGDQTFEEVLQILWQDERFLADSAYRRSVLVEVRDLMRRGRVHRPVALAIAVRIDEIFGSGSVKVRFRSSSNAEDSTFFPGAGLYDSTSACAPDSFDEDGSGPCRCDATEANERTIERALRRVWASMWNFRAVEERMWYGLDERMVRMGVLVTPAFLNEAVNGVLLSGHPTDPTLPWLHVSSQVGDTSVVTPPEGTIPELDILVPQGDDGFKIIRGAGSSLLDPGQFVMSDGELLALADILAGLQQFWRPPEYIPRDLLRLDVEFKLELDRHIVVKQVRPYTIPGADVFARNPKKSLVTSSACWYAIPEDALDVFDVMNRKVLLRLDGRQHLLPLCPGTQAHEWFEGLRLAGTDFVAPGPGLVETVVSVDRWNTGYIDVSWRLHQSLEGGDSWIKTEFGAAVARGPNGLDTSSVSFDFGRVTIQQGGRTWPALLWPCCSGQYPLYEIEVRLSSGTILLYERRVPNDSRSPLLVRAEVLLDGEPRIMVDDFEALAAVGPGGERRRAYLVHLPVSDDSRHAVHVAFLLGHRNPRVTFLDEAGTILAEAESVSWRDRLLQAAATVAFRRGDVNADGVITPRDAIFLLQALFTAGPLLPCPDAADLDDDGDLRVSDAVILLRSVFTGADLAPPCAKDQTIDLLPPCTYEPWICGP